MHRLRSFSLARRGCGFIAASVLMLSCETNAQGALRYVDLAEHRQLITTDLAGVSRVVELGDGRLAMVETYNPSLTIMDSDGGNVNRVGRRGSGPGEFRSPSQILQIHPDTLAVAELVGRRIHLFDSHGVYVRTGQLPAGPLYVIAALYADTTGWLYILNRGNPVTALQRGRDSIGVMRARVDQAVVDSIWAIGTSRLVEVPLEQGVTFRVPEFSTEDGLGVAADGTILRASARTQTFAAWKNGTGRTLGGGWGLQVRRVTAAERDSVANALDAIPIFKGIKPVFATNKPVFDQLEVAPDGEIWMRLTEPRERRVVYRVFSASGSARVDAAVPPGFEVAGIGKSHLYLIQSAGDSTGTLIRAPRP